jgi:hypothetical protein
MRSRDYYHNVMTIGIFLNISRDQMLRFVLDQNSPSGGAASSHHLGGFTGLNIKQNTAFQQFLPGQFEYTSSLYAPSDMGE